jgi:hypothetical protein
MVLDVDPLNNSYRIEKNRTPTTKIVAGLVFWLQNIMQLTAVVG